MVTSAVTVDTSPVTFMPVESFQCSPVTGNFGPTTNTTSMMLVAPQLMLPDPNGNNICIHIDAPSPPIIVRGTDWGPAIPILFMSLVVIIFVVSTIRAKL